MEIEGYRLHHLACGAVSQDHCRHQVLIGKIEGFDGELSHLLNGGGGEYQYVIISVSAAACGLEVV